MIDTQDVVLAKLARELVKRFAPDRIVLFGSRARGDHHAESDYDLMIVLDQSPYSEIVVRRAVQDLRVSADVFVDTREQFERRRRDVGTLEYAADQEGRILYRNSALPEPRHLRERPTPPESLADWIARAESDLAMMEAGLRHAPHARDGIVFHAHQATEKILKAALIARHVPPPRTHELTQLLAQLPSEVRNVPSLAEACRGLQALWPNSRYPREPIPTPRDVGQAVEWARRVREILAAALNELRRALKSEER